MSPLIQFDKSEFKKEKDLPHSLQQSLKSVTKTEDYISYNIIIRQINTSGGNFLGDLFIIDIKAYLFSNESFFYKEMSQVFTLLQDEAGVAPGDRLKLAKAYTETSTEVIILDNLSIKGFKIYNRMEALPLKCVELAIQQMAKFHGLSFVIESRMPEYFQEKIKNLDHPMKFDGQWEGLMRKIFAYVADLFKDTTKAKVEKFMFVYFDKFNKYRNDKTSTKCTLSHGDFRSTNILVRQENGEPEEVIIVDYQFMDYGCPIRDLSYILCANTDQELRRNHMNALKELYFKTLSRFLKYFDMDIEAVYPKKEFEKVFSERLIYGLMMTFCSIHVLYAPETGMDLTTDNLSELPFSLDDDIKDRIRKLIQDFVDWGYL